MRRFSRIALICGGLVLLGGTAIVAIEAGGQDVDQLIKKAQELDEDVHHVNQWMNVHEAVAVIRPTRGNDARGVVRFTDVEDGVRVVARITGLVPNQQHAFHIHQYGDASARDGTSAGGHYDPAGSAHHAAANADDAHHAGDLGNLQADDSGKAIYDSVIHRVTVAGLEGPIVGRGVIIHAGHDQFTQPTGGAGARIGIGVIGVAKPSD